MKIELTLTPDEVDEDGDPILVNIEAAVASTVADRVRPAIEKHIQAGIETEIKAVVDANVASWVETAVTKPVQRTDGYGHPTGDPVSFEGFVADIVRQFLTTRVDTYGGERSTRSLTRLEWIVRKYANELIAKELAANLAEHRTELAKAMGDIVAASAAAIKT